MITVKLQENEPHDPLTFSLYKNVGVVYETLTNYHQNPSSGFSSRTLAKLAHNGFDKK